MSAYMIAQCDFVQKETLLEALRLLDLTPTIHEEPQTLRGFQNDDRSFDAHIIVGRSQLNAKFTNVSNDLGFRWNEGLGQYDVICSDYDRELGVLGRLKQAYFTAAVQSALDKNHFNIEEVAGVEGLRSRPRVNVEMVTSKVI